MVYIFVVKYVKKVFRSQFCEERGHRHLAHHSVMIIYIDLLYSSRHSTVPIFHGTQQFPKQTVKDLSDCMAATL